LVDITDRLIREDKRGIFLKNYSLYCVDSAFHTGQDIEQIGKDTDRDNFMNAVQAKAYGLIDDVLDKRKV